MPINRRHFLRAGAVALAAAAAPLSLSALAAEARSASKGAAGQPGSAHGLMSKAAFAPHLHTVFRIRPQGRSEIAAELIELQDCGQPRDGRDCFSLVFRAPGQRPLAQATYRVEHRSLGNFDLFIGPVKSGKSVQLYEAIINHQRA